MPIWSQRWQFAHTEMVKNCIQKVWKLNKQLYFPAKKSPTFVRALSVWFIGGGACHPVESLSLSCEINYFVKFMHSFNVSRLTAVRSLYRVSIQSIEKIFSSGIFNISQYFEKTRSCFVQVFVFWHGVFRRNCLKKMIDS